jgi:hypothetical protein
MDYKQVLVFEIVLSSDTTTNVRSEQDIIKSNWNSYFFNDDDDRR